MPVYVTTDAEEGSSFSQRVDEEEDLSEAECPELQEDISEELGDAEYQEAVANVATSKADTQLATGMSPSASTSIGPFRRGCHPDSVCPGFGVA